MDLKEVGVIMRNSVGDYWRALVIVALNLRVSLTMELNVPVPTYDVHSEIAERGYCVTEKNF